MTHSSSQAVAAQRTNSHRDFQNASRQRRAAGEESPPPPLPSRTGALHPPAAVKTTAHPKLNTALPPASLGDRPRHGGRPPPSPPPTERGAPPPRPKPPAERAAAATSATDRADDTSTTRAAGVGATAGSAAAPPPPAAVARGGGGAPAVDGGVGSGRSQNDHRVGCTEVPRWGGNRRRR